MAELRGHYHRSLAVQMSLCALPVLQALGQLLNPRVVFDGNQAAGQVLLRKAVLQLPALDKGQVCLERAKQLKLPKLQLLASNMERCLGGAGTSPRYFQQTL